MLVKEFSAKCYELLAPITLALVSFGFLSVLGFDFRYLLPLLLGVSLVFKFSFGRWIFLGLTSLITIGTIFYTTLSLSDSYVRVNDPGILKLPASLIFLFLLIHSQGKRYESLTKEARYKLFRVISIVALLGTGLSLGIYRFTNDHDSLSELSQDYAQKKYDSYRSCLKDEDCISKGELCPLGCSLTINKKYEFQYSVLIIKMNKNCAYQCLAISSEPKCIANKCEREVLDKMFH